MGSILLPSHKETFRLRPRCLVGRASSCDVRIDDMRVSNEHAVIQYCNGGWELRDLNSRNGTYVAGRKIAPRGVLLHEGMEFAVGDLALIFRLIDAAAPVAAARNKATGVTQPAVNGVVLLPDHDRPTVTIFERLDGHWVAESASEQRIVVDRDVLLVDGAAWTLELPAPSNATVDTGSMGPSIDTIGLRFAVTSDDGHIELTMLHLGEETKVARRAHHHLLLTLARARLAAPQEGDDEGWMDREQLCRMLAIDSSKLNTDIHRARGQFGLLGVRRPADLIIRRQDTGQLCLGVRHIEVVRLSSPGQGGPPSSGRGEPT